MQEKYSKPDCQKDLTEAEVSVRLCESTGENCVFNSPSKCVQSVDTIFQHVGRRQKEQSDLVCFLFPAEDDAEFSRRGGGAPWLLPL